MANHAEGTVGQQLGNYSLMRLLGQGGFANVYLGKHVYLDTFAAIKVLHTRLVDDALEAFLNEARTIASLVHPHIVRVLDFGVEADTPFLVMEYAPNGTLRKRHPKGVRLPLDLIVQYVNQIAAGLQYAHDRKLIHRDVKPENVLLGVNSEVLLSDFGLVLVAQSSHFQNTQDAVGTMTYMAPEQLQGKPRPASDQYALGVIAYEWISGECLFEGSFTEVASQHMLAAPPSLHEKVPTISPDIERVVQIALAKDPRQRFASVQMFATALEQACLPLLSVQTNHPIISPVVEPIAPRPSSSWLPSPASTPDNQLLQTPVLMPQTDAPPSPPFQPSNPGQSPVATLKLAPQPNFVTPSPDAFLAAGSVNGPSSPSPVSWANQGTVPAFMPPSPAYGKKSISRRTILLGLTGLAGLALAGGGITLFVQTLQTPTVPITPDPTRSPSTKVTQAPITSHATATPTPKHKPTPTPTPTPTVALGAVVSSGPGISLQLPQSFSFDSGVAGSSGGDVLWQELLQLSNTDSGDNSKMMRALDANGSAKLVNLGVFSAVIFDAITPTQLRAVPYNAVQIIDDQLPMGDIFAVLTNGGNHAKVQVLLHAGANFEIRWVTYRG